MKKLLILFAATALVTGLCLRDSSRLRADENDPNDPDNVELVTPPTSPDAEKFYDGNVIISYDLDDDESGQVAGETNEGKTDRLPGLQPDQIVKVTLQLGANRAGHTIQTAALDGGQVLDVENGLVADESGTLRFNFQVGHEPGLYQVALRDVDHEIGVQFWVINNANPEGNLQVDLPGGGTEATVSENPVETQAGNDNPTGPCGQYNGNITTGCSYDPYTANGTRAITDLVVPGAVGMYPLAFTRTMTTRYISGLRYQMGEAGNWLHSYQWSIDSNSAPTGQQFPTIYWVNYPDGRRVQFSAPSPSPSPMDRDFRGPSGIGDRFEQLSDSAGLSPTECYLRLIDGGQIHFHAEVNAGTYSYTLKEIIDPYRQKLTVDYPDDMSMTIKEPAGRILKIFYTHGPTGAQNDVVITRVEWWSAEDGHRVQAVYYGYTAIGAYSALTSVKYADGTNATYSYQNSNRPSESARPLIKTCVDPMFAGSMWKIAYEFTAFSPGSFAVYGQLRSERYFDGTNVGQPVSSLTITATNTRKETRGDGPQRTCTYTGYQITGATDFKNISASSDHDPQGYVGSLTDGNGNTTNYTNDPWTGNVIAIGYPCDDEHCHHNPPATTYEYGSLTCRDPNNRDPNNPYYLYGTTSGKKPKSRARQKRGYTAQYWRDDHKRVLNIYSPNIDASPHQTESYTYNDFDQALTHRLKTGGVESWTYDGRGLVQEYRDASHNSPAADAPESEDPAPTPFPGASLTYAYYTSGPSMDRVQSIRDARGFVTTFTYDVRGQVLTTTAPGPTNPTVTNAYNPNGTLASTTDELGHTTRYTYDDYKRVTSTTLPPPAQGPVPSSTTFSYDPTATSAPGDASYIHTTANPTLVISPTGKAVKTIYDADFLKSSVTVGYGTSDTATTSFIYDNNGNQTKVTDPKGNVTEYDYDRENRVIWMNDPLVNATPVPHMNSEYHTTSWGYDGIGNITRILNANDQTILNEYTDQDFPDRLMRTVVKLNNVPETAITKYTYYDSGLVKTMQDPHLVRSESTKTYTYGYDLMGRKTKLTYPIASGGGSQDELWTYDTAGNLYTFQNRNNDIQTFGYDERNRTTGFTWSANASWLSLAYDDASRVTQIANADATIVNTYFDDNTLHTQEEWAANEVPTIHRTVTYGYDADLSPISIIYPNSHTFAYNYTNRNQVASIQDTMLSYYPAVYTYDPNGNVTDSTIGGVVSNSDLQYDKLNMCTHISRTFVGTTNPTRTLDYEYDAMNDRTSIKQDLGTPIGTTKTYGYDLAQQSTTESGGTTFDYNANGNRRGNQFLSNDLSQYDTFSNLPVQYDTKGNLRTYNGWIYTYDAQNRTTQATKGSTTETFKYDGLNRQISQTLNGVTKYNVWDGWNLIEEYATGATTPTSVYVYGRIGEILERINSDGTTNLYFQGALGSTSHLADAAGHLLEAYKYSRTGTPSFYDAAGTLRNPNQSAYGIRHLFHGQLWTQETGLNDYRNRMQLPAIGVFMQPDPIGFNGDPTNLYRFCGNNGLNRLDPLGLDPLSNYYQQQAMAMQQWSVDRTGPGPDIFQQAEAAVSIETEYLLISAEVAIHAAGLIHIGVEGIEMFGSEFVVPLLADGDVKLNIDGVSVAVDSSVQELDLSSGWTSYEAEDGRTYVYDSNGSYVGQIDGFTSLAAAAAYGWSQYSTGPSSASGGYVNVPTMYGGAGSGGGIPLGGNGGWLRRPAPIIRYP